MILIRLNLILLVKCLSSYSISNPLITEYPVVGTQIQLLQNKPQRPIDCFEFKLLEKQAVWGGGWYIKNKQTKNNNNKINILWPPSFFLKVGNKSPMWRYPPYARRIESILIARVREFKAKESCVNRFCYLFISLLLQAQASLFC